MADPRRVASPDVLVEDAPGQPLWRLRLHGEPSREALEPLGRLLGAEWPCSPNTVSGVQPRALWLSPCEWLVEGQGLPPQAVSGALAGVLHHFVEVTDAMAAIEIKGPLARALVAGGCSLDLHPRGFGPGRCAQSQLAGVPVLIRNLDPEDGLRLYVDVSLSTWLRSWLAAAAETLRP